MKFFSLTVAFLLGYFAVSGQVDTVNGRPYYTNLPTDTLKCVVYYPNGKLKLELNVVNNCVTGEVIYHRLHAPNSYVRGYIDNDCAWEVLNDEVFSFVDTTYNHIKTGDWQYWVMGTADFRSFNKKKK